MISASVTHLLLVTSRRGGDERLSRLVGYKQTQHVQGGRGEGGLGGSECVGPRHFDNNVRALVASDTTEERKGFIVVRMFWETCGMLVTFF